MRTPSVSIKVQGGKCHNSIIQVKLIHEEETEKLLIKYGSMKNFLPCCVIKRDEEINLHAALVGSLGDIKLPFREWQSKLSILGCKQLNN